MGVSRAVGPAEQIGSVTVREDSPVTWGGLVAEQEAYVAEKEAENLVFVGDGPENAGEIMSVTYTHRFTQEYVKQDYARLNDFVRGAFEEYENPYIVMLPALTASTTDAVGNYRPPLDHFDQLKRSWSRGVRYELNHVMDADREKDKWPAREWEYLQIWEPTTDAGYADGGYAHLHPVVVCDGKVGAQRFRSVLEKHVEKCEWARSEAHDLNEIDIRPLDALANPAAYLFKYLSKSWDPEDAESYQRRFNALLYETGYRRFQPSNGAQRWMQRDGGNDDEGDEWIFAGVGNDGQIETLQGYGDAHEFRVEHEMGVGSWLAEYEAPSAVAFDAADHRWKGGRCTRCGFSERALMANKVPWDGPASECPGKPPPGG